jgi:hypothetical protein
MSHTGPQQTPSPMRLHDTHHTIQGPSSPSHIGFGPRGSMQGLSMSHTGPQQTPSPMRLHDTHHTIQGPSSRSGMPQNGPSVAANTLPKLPVGSQIAIGPPGQMEALSMSHAGPQLDPSPMWRYEPQHTVHSSWSTASEPLHGRSISQRVVPNTHVGTQSAVGPRHQMAGLPLSATSPDVTPTPMSRLQPQHTSLGSLSGGTATRHAGTVLPTTAMGVQNAPGSPTLVYCNRKCRGKNLAVPGRKGCRQCLDYDREKRLKGKERKGNATTAAQPSTGAQPVGSTPALPSAPAAPATPAALVTGAITPEDTAQ